MNQEHVYETDLATPDLFKSRLYSLLRGIKLLVFAEGFGFYAKEQTIPDGFGFFIPDLGC